MGESLRSVTSRLIDNAHEPLSSLPFISLVHLCHLSSPEPQTSQHMLSTLKNSFIGFSLHGKHRAGACGCSSHRNGGDEIDDEKNHSLLANSVQVIMETAAVGFFFYLYLYFSTCSLSFSPHFEITGVTKGEKGEQKLDVLLSQLNSLNTYKLLR